MGEVPASMMDWVSLLDHVDDELAEAFVQEVGEETYITIYGQGVTLYGHRGGTIHLYRIVAVCVWRC